MPYALITGASTGLGREFAYLCAADGFDLVITSRSEAPLNALAVEIRQKYSRTVRVIAADLSRPDAPAAIFNGIQDIQTSVEVLINNAGFGLVGKFWELDEPDQMAMVSVNVAAVTHLSRLFLPGLVSRRKGRILNVASTAAFQPGPLMAVYYASKAYVVWFSEAIDNEARDFGVRVTAFCPGPTATEFNKRSGLKPTRLWEANVMPAHTAAKIGYAAMKKGKPLVIAGRKNALLAFLTRFAPRQLAVSMARKFQEG